MPLPDRFEFDGLAPGPCAEAKSRADRRRWLCFVRQALDAGLLGYKASRVAHALETYCGPDGCFPSHKSLAAAAGCSERHAIRSVERLEVLGMLCHRSRYATRKGRVVRTSNRYTLLVPLALPGLQPKAPVLRIPSALKKKVEELIPESSGIVSVRSVEDIAADRAAIERRRQMVEAGLLPALRGPILVPPRSRLGLSWPPR